MAQVGVDSLDRVGLALVIHARMRAPPAQLAVGVEGVRVIAPSVRRSVNDRLHHFRGARLADRPRDDAARRPLDDGDDVGSRFFEPTKVNNSSISSVSGAVTTCSAAGKPAWKELTRLTTD